MFSLTVHSKMKFGAYVPTIADKECVPLLGMHRTRTAVRGSTRTVRVRPESSSSSSSSGISKHS
jgi:hypothetical protein